MVKTGLKEWRMDVVVEGSLPRLKFQWRMCTHNIPSPFWGWNFKYSCTHCIPILFQLPMCAYSIPSLFRCWNFKNTCTHSIPSALGRWYFKYPFVYTVYSIVEISITHVYSQHTQSIYSKVRISMTLVYLQHDQSSKFKISLMHVYSQHTQSIIRVKFLTPMCTLTHSIPNLFQWLSFNYPYVLTAYIASFPTLKFQWRLCTHCIHSPFRGWNFNYPFVLKCTQSIPRLKFPLPMYTHSIPSLF